MKYRGNDGWYTVREYQGRDPAKAGLYRVYRNGTDGWKPVTKDWLRKPKAENQLKILAIIHGWKEVKK